MGFPGLRAVTAAGLTVLWLALLAAGCTSDSPGLVGTGLVTAHIDSVLVPLGITTVEQYMGKNVSQVDIPVPRQEVLYLGEQGGTSSSILINYDFRGIFTPEIPAEAYTFENIVSVDLRLLMLEYYSNLNTDAGGEGDETRALGKYYEVFQLDAPFDSTAYPGPVPPHDPTDLNIAPGLEESSYLTLPLPVSFFLGWVANDTLQGLMVGEGNGSTDGLIGFSARDMKHGGSALPPVNADIVPGPALLVKFLDPDTTLVIPPVADTSTFDTIAEAPATPDDGFMMRTCLRSYPILRFDMSSLPDNISVNRAVLYVVNDTSTSFGNLEAIVVSEYHMDWFGVPGDSIPLADLDDVTYNISGMSSLDPTSETVLQFNVTTAVQRIVNDVYEGERGFILTAGEDFFPNYDLSAVDPDFFLTQFNFFGTAAADSLRPQLRITYSSIDELTGGGE